MPDRKGVANALSGFSGTLAAAPQFLQQTIANQNPQILPGTNSQAIAHVEYGDPKHVYIDRPDQADQPILNHELTHVYQNTLAQPPTEGSGLFSGGAPNYDYGGWQGLIDAQAKKKTLRDFTDEQQGAMIEDYSRLKDQLAKNPKMAGEFDLANRAMGPLMRQMTTFPTKAQQPFYKYDQGTIDTKAAFPAPAAPPATVSGIATPLPEFGGAKIDLSAGMRRKK